MSKNEPPVGPILAVSGLILLCAGEYCSFIVGAVVLYLISLALSGKADK